MIKLEHVSKSYSAGIPALNDVNLEIEDGEFRRSSKPILG